MPRVVGIDPGTVSIDVCGLSGGRLVDRPLVADRGGARRSGGFRRGTHGERRARPGRRPFGVRPAAPPCRRDERPRSPARLPGAGRASRAASAASGFLTRALADAGLPLVLLPGVIHLDTVPEHRKINRIDLGTSDKLCAAALGIHDQALRLGGHAARDGLRAAGAGRCVHGGARGAERDRWSTVWAAAADRSAGRPPARSTARWPTSPARSTRRCCSRAASRRWRRRIVMRRAPASRPSSRARSRRCDSCSCRRRSPSEVLVSGRIASDPAVRERLAAALGDHRGAAPDRLRVARQAGRAGRGAAGRRSRRRHAPGLVETMRIREASGRRWTTCTSCRPTRPVTRWSWT